MPETLHLLHSQYDFQFVLKLPLRHTTNLLLSAREKKQEDRAWQMWLSEYPHMNKENFMPFSEYYERIRQPALSNINTKPKETLLAEMNEIRKRFEGSPAPET